MLTNIHSFSSPVRIKGPSCSDTFDYMYVPSYTVIELTSPNGKGKYPKNTNCGWLAWVSVQFIAFNDGRNSIVALCGSK